MSYGNDDSIMLSDDIADEVQVEHQKNIVYLSVNDSMFELESLQYKRNNIKTIHAFGNIVSMLQLIEQGLSDIQLIVNNEQKYKFCENDIEELQINNISTNCNIIITIRDIK